MKLFGKTKMQQFESVLASLRKRAALLADKKITAQAVLDGAIAARQAHMIDGDLGDERLALKLQSSVDSAQSCLVGIIDAISILQSQIATADQALATEQNRVKREAAATEIAENVAEVERLPPDWLAQSRQLADALRKLDHTFEAGQLAGFVSGCAGEAEVAVAVVLRELRSLPKLIVSGDRPIPHRPEPVAPVAVIKPVLTQLFTLHAIQWTDEHGMLRHLGKWRDVELPAEAAECALRLGLCAPMSDPRRAKLVNQSRGHPEPNWINDLDTETGPDIAKEATAVEPIQHSAFTVVDRGGPFVLKVAK